MSPNRTAPAPSIGPSDGLWAAYKGWLVGFLIIAAVLVISAGLWLTYHP
jgi:hypothetical protein